MSWHQGFVIVWKPPDGRVSVMWEALAFSEAMAWKKLFSSCRAWESLDEVRAEGAKDYYFVREVEMRVSDEAILRRGDDSASAE